MKVLIDIKGKEILYPEEILKECYNSNFLNKLEMNIDLKQKLVVEDQKKAKILFWLTVIFFVNDLSKLNCAKVTR